MSNIKFVRMVKVLSFSVLVYGQSPKNFEIDGLPNFLSYEEMTTCMPCLKVSSELLQGNHCAVLNKISVLVGI